MADYKTKIFYGTPQTIFDYSTDILANNFSAAGTVFDNTSDSAVPYATHAIAVIKIPGWGANMTAAAAVELWGCEQDIDGASVDETNEPSGTASNGAHFIGAWAIPVQASTAAMSFQTIISLEGIRKLKPFIRNGTAQNMNNDGGTNMVVKITPFAYGTTV